jgi:hypothetical protein
MGWWTVGLSEHGERLVGGRAGLDVPGFAFKLHWPHMTVNAGRARTDRTDTLRHLVP